MQTLLKLSTIICVGLYLSSCITQVNVPSTANANQSISFTMQFGPDGNSSGSVTMGYQLAMHVPESFSVTSVGYTSSLITGTDYGTENNAYVQDLITDVSPADPGYKWVIFDTNGDSYQSDNSGNVTVIVYTGGVCGSFDRIRFVGGYGDAPGVDWANPTPYQTITISDGDDTPTISQNGNQLSSSTPADNTWLNGSKSAISGATGQTYSPTASGLYYVVNNTGNGCPDTSDVFVFNAISREATLAEAVEVYPNPTTDIVTIGGLPKSTHNVKISSLAGQVLYEGLPVHNRLDLSGFDAGLYLLRIESSEGVVLKQLVKQ